MPKAPSFQIGMGWNLAGLNMHRLTESISDIYGVIISRWRPWCHFTAEKCCHVSGAYAAASASWWSIGGPAAQVCRLGPKVGGRLSLFCILIAWIGRTLAMTLSHDDSTINIVLVSSSSSLLKRLFLHWMTCIWRCIDGRGEAGERTSVVMYNGSEYLHRQLYRITLHHRFHRHWSIPLHLLERGGWVGRLQRFTSTSAGMTSTRCYSLAGAPSSPSFRRGWPASSSTRPITLGGLHIASTPRYTSVSGIVPRPVTTLFSSLLSECYYRSLSRLSVTGASSFIFNSPSGGFSEFTFR